MSLQPGHKLAHYEILEPIGKGGMGEVYRAKDSKLGRDVAIKVLPDAFAQDEERLRRFQREAKVLASLNHPKIASIYGLEQAGDTHYLVLELVPGETLAERIARGPISVDEALDIATKIAEALEEAHEQGIVHRDLKPANVKLTEDDEVKVLDFGLAKAFVEDRQEGDVATSMSPTITRDATRVGVVLGTAAYMSPEQARGKRVDRRADIWAFGVVLYEMLTGRRAFEAEDVSLTLAEVMKSEPDRDALPADLSPSARTFLIRCFEKEPKARVRDIGDVRLALHGVFETGAPIPSAPEALDARGHMLWPALAALLALVTGAAVWSLKPEAPGTLVRSIVNPPSMPPELNTGDTDLAISADGSRIVYLSRAERRQLVVRSLDALETTPLVTGGGWPRGVFLSPNGDWVGYFEGSVMRKISVLGGPPRTICEIVGGPRGASWGADDTIVFAINNAGGLWRVSASGGEPERLTTPDSANGNHLFPELLPNGEGVLFTMLDTTVDSARIAVFSFASGRSKILIPGGSNPRYARSGHIVYGFSGSLRAVGFDLERLEVTGEPVSVLDGVVVKDSGAADFAISQNGSLAYMTGDIVRAAPVWVNRDGSEEAIAFVEDRPYAQPRVAPDGSRLAISTFDQEGDVWIWSFARATLTRLTFDPASNGEPRWSPDGKRVAFHSRRGQRVFNLFWKLADGTGAVERLTESTYNQNPGAFSPDGSMLVFEENNPETGFDLHVLSMDGEGKTMPLLVTEFNELDPDISPDGRWIAFQSNESGNAEVYVRPFPDVDSGRWQISRGGGTRPRWSRDGNELLYLSAIGQLMSVPVTPAPFALGNPELVLDESYLTYDVSPDGNRFLMMRRGTPGENAEPAQVILVQNWTEELKRVVPVDN